MYGWNLSWFYYVLAVISLIVAIIYAIFNGVQTCELTAQDQRNQVNATAFFLAAIALAVLAVVAHGYHKGAMARKVVSELVR